MMDDRTILTARKHIRIAHHIPGRIRLRFQPNILSDLPQFTAAEGKSLLSRFAGILDVRVNASALSAIVSYDRSKLPSCLWEKLINGTRQQAEDAVAEMKRPAP